MAQERSIAVVPETTAIAISDPEIASMFSDARIALIRNQTARDAPDSVFAAMIDIAKRRRLDPLAKQIIVAKFKDTWQMIVTIDGYRSIAEQTGRYAGNDAPVFTWPDEPVLTSWGKSAPESATVTVYKLVEGQRYPFSATVYWEEFDGKKNNWLSMPRTMLAKVAESHALRKAFPAVLSGTYTQEEMDQASIEVSGQMVQRAAGEIPASVRSAPPQRPRTEGSAQRHQSQAGPRPSGQADGKAKHYRMKLADLGDRIGWSDADLDAVAVYDHQRPIEELSGDELETTYRDLDELYRTDRDALGTLRRAIHESRDAVMTAIEADGRLPGVDAETGEVIDTEALAAHHRR